MRPFPRHSTFDIRHSAFFILALALLAGAAVTAQDDDGYGPAEPAATPATPPVSTAATPAMAADGDAPSIVYNKWHTPNPGEVFDYNQRTRLMQRGRLVYNQYCVGCHGENGDGMGPAAARLITKPRDFTSGIYKFRSTDSSSLPLETDLHRTLIRGLSRVSMPAFPLMPEHDRVAVIEYIKGFYPRWDAEAASRKVVDVPRAPQDLHDPQRVLRGRVVYLAMQCGKCHGSDGAGTGATQQVFQDAWGHNQAAFNFTRGRLKGGDDPEDIYRTFHTGLRSIMPAYAGVTLASANLETFETQANYLAPGEREQLAPVLGDFPKTAAEVFTGMDAAKRDDLSERNSWDLVAYIESLRRPISTAEAVVGPRPQ